MALPAFKNGKPLFKDGKPCFADGPCTCGGCTGTGVCTGVAYTVTAALSWGDTADLDLYGRIDSNAVCFFGGNVVSGTRREAGGLTLNGDVYPGCVFTLAPPEVMELYPVGTHATAAHTFRFWYARYSDCVTPTPAATTTITVSNVGTTDICVNGQRVTPGNSWTTDVMAYTDTRGSTSINFTGGTVVEVTCAG